MTAFPARRWYLGLASAFALFTLYGSLIPFAWRPLSLADAWQQFSLLVLDVPPGRISRTDFLANILLFIPWGFSMCGAILADRRSRRLAVAAPVVVLAAGLVLSTLAEFLQTFTPGRVPTHRDIAAQTLGSSVGIALWVVFGDVLTTWTRSSLATAPANRRWRVLALIVTAWVLVSLAPFDISVDIGDIARRVRMRRIVLIPFSDPGLTTWRRMWDMFAEVLGAVPLGLLLSGRLGRHSPVATIARGVAIVFLIEAAQVFLRSHTASVTDAFFGSLGVIAGVVWGARYPLDQTVLDPPAGRGVSRPAVGIGIAWLVILAFYHWQPFDVAMNAQTIKNRLDHLSLVPFATYAAGSPINALNDILTKLGLALPLGGVCAFVPRQRQPLTRTTIATWTCVGIAVFTMLEFGQLFLRSRTPDVTDVWTGAVGVLAGAIVTHWARSDSATH